MSKDIRIWFKKDLYVYSYSQQFNFWLKYLKFKQVLSFKSMGGIHSIGNNLMSAKQYFSNKNDAYFKINQINVGVFKEILLMRKLHKYDHQLRFLSNCNESPGMFCENCYSIWHTKVLRAKRVFTLNMLDKNAKHVVQ